MNIDLFLTSKSENGLILNERFDDPVTGVILDAETNLMTLEFARTGDTFHLNIPIEEDYKDQLLFSSRIQIGVLQDQKINDYAEVPLLYLNDPYGSAFGDMSHTGRPSQSLLQFEQFMKRCTFAQAIHRDDLGDEGSVGSVLKGVNPKALEYAPHLARQHALEHGARVQHDIQFGAAPGMAPKGPGGMGGGNTGRRIIRQAPPSRQDDE